MGTLNFQPLGGRNVISVMTSGQTEVIAVAQVIAHLNHHPDTDLTKSLVSKLGVQMIHQGISGKEWMNGSEGEPCNASFRAMFRPQLQPPYPVSAVCCLPESSGGFSLCHSLISICRRGE